MARLPIQIRSPFSLVLAGGAALVVALLIALVGPYPELAHRFGERHPFEIRPASTTAEAAAILEAIGASGRDLYLRQLRWDYLLISAYGAGILVLGRGLTGLARWRHGRAIVPAIIALLPVVADTVENMALRRIVTDAPEVDWLWLEVARIATYAKLGTLALAGVVLVVLGTRTIVRFVGDTA